MGRVRVTYRDADGRVVADLGEVDAEVSVDDKGVVVSYRVPGDPGPFPEPVSLSVGLYQCPRCYGPSEGPGSCRSCLGSAEVTGVMPGRDVSGGLPADYLMRWAAEDRQQAALNAKRLEWLGPWSSCSDPPAESCSDAGCPVHGDSDGEAGPDPDGRVSRDEPAGGDPLLPEWFLATCEDCTPRLPQPFRDFAGRAEWAKAHRDATGHSVVFSEEGHRG